VAKNGDKVVPHRVTERFTWKCPVKGCGGTGKVAKKSDIKFAIMLHKAQVH